VARVEELQVLARACGELDDRLRDSDVSLDAKTPCDGWTIRDLLQHVIVGNRTAVVMLEGHSSEEVVAARTTLLAEDRIGDDPAAAFATSAAAQVAAFAQPGALERTIHHHFMGDMPSRQLLSFRICDLTLHAWDLARATGADEAINAGLVEWVYAAMEPTSPTIGSTGQFGDGPSAALPDDAPLQTRLLDLSGRRP
jgi:uncharacterized protein (TIGR03086 family)